LLLGLGLSKPTLGVDGPHLRLSDAPPDRFIWAYNKAKAIDVGIDFPSNGSGGSLFGADMVVETRF